MSGEHPNQRDAEASAADAPADPAAAENADTESLLARLEDARACVVRDLDGAFRALDAIAPAIERSGDRRAASRLRAVRAHALNYATRYAEATDEAQEAVRLAEAAGDAIEAARAWMVLVHARAKLGDLEGALRSALAAERAFTDAGRLDLAVQALANAAIVTRMTGDADGAIGMFERALAMRDHDPATRAQIESGLAESLLDAGRFADAEAAFVRSAETFESSGVTRAAAIVRGNLADLYGRQGRLASAIEQFEVARRFFEADEATGELGRILTEQADVYAATGLTDEAIAGYRRAGDLLESVGAVQERARALTGLGRLLATRDPERARRSLEEAAALDGKAGNVAGRALATLHLAALHHGLGEHERAHELLAEASAALADRGGEALLCDLLAADLALAGGDAARADEILTRGADRAAAVGLPVLRAETLGRRSAARRAAGRLDAAIEDARAAIDGIERLRGTLRGSRFRAGLMGGNRSIYAHAVGLLLEAGSAIEAFEITERARGRTLLDLMGGGAEIHAGAGEENGDTAPGTDDPATSAMLRSLGGALADLNAVYTGHDPTAGGASHAAWKERLREAEDRVSALETRLHATARGREVLGVPEGFARIADRLGLDRALVAYWDDGGTLVAFVVRGGRLSVVRLAPMDEIEGAIQEAQFQIRRGLVRGPASGRGAGGNSVERSNGADRRTLACRRALAALHGLVWAPITDALGDAEGVAIVPAGPLHAVPFAALHDGSRYLVERIEPVVLPMASLLPILAKRDDESSGDLRAGSGGGEPSGTRSAGTGSVARRVSVFAVPDRIAPEIETEAAVLRDTMPGARVVVGADATADAARRAAADAGILHLACHGAFPPNNPLAAGLKLADRWVTVRDVLGWRLPGSVVVLSGCDTGRSSLDSGEELYGFGRGFLAAGARGLVMSLWSAHDATTRGLMAEMYRTLEAGSGEGSKAASVRAALVSAQRSRIETGIHPAFWSHFVYLGV